MTAAASRAKGEQHPGDKPSGKERAFSVTIRADMILDESVIAQGLADDGYVIGKNPTEDDVLRHLAYNLVGNGLCLSQIDGFANCPDASARIVSMDAEVDGEIESPK